MSEQVKLLAFAGSLRKDSYNKRLVKVAVKQAESQGAQVTFVDFNDYQMPLFNEDDEAENGIHPTAMKLKKLMLEADGFLIASPEYNGGYSGVLKNAIDWASRQAEGEKVLECFKNKVVGLFAASPGALGGIRGLTQIRTILSGIGCIVLPDQLALPKAGEAFNEDGSLVSEMRQKAVVRITDAVVNVSASLK